MFGGDIRLQCKVCGMYFIQEGPGELSLTTEQRCARLAVETGETVIAYKFTCPECEEKFQ